MKLLLLALALTAASSARAQVLIQAESALESRQVLGGELSPDRKLSAWGGACLGNGWGGAVSDWARFPIAASGGPQVLHLRYARGPREGVPQAKLSVQLEGGAPIEVELPVTGEWDVWRWLAIPLGSPTRGAHFLRLGSLAQSPLNVDALIVSSANSTPPEVARQLLFEEARPNPRVQLQLSPGVGEADGSKLLERGVETFEFLCKYLGEQPSRRLTVQVIGADAAGENFVGHSVGYEMYLEGARIEDTSHNWVHEMTHCFQRESGPWPTWLSEGEAWLAHYDAELSLWKRPPEQIRASPAFFRQNLPRYQAALMVGGRNLLQRWGQEDFPRDKTGAAYGMANFILADLRESFGPELMQKYRALLRGDRARGVRDEDGAIEARDAAIVARLGRAAGEDLRARFEGWGFVLVTPRKPDAVTTPHA